MLELKKLLLVIESVEGDRIAEIPLSKAFESWEGAFSTMICALNGSAEAKETVDLIVSAARSGDVQRRALGMFGVIFMSMALRISPHARRMNKRWPDAKKERA